jgi:hypothetical protein
MRRFYVQSKQFVTCLLLLTDNMEASSFICTTLCYAIHITVKKSAQ